MERNRNRKGYTLAALFLSLLFILASCSSNNSSPSSSGSSSNTPANSAAAPDKTNEKRTIRVLYLPDQFWLDQVAEFEKTTGINVEYESLPFPQLHDTMATAFVGGSSQYDVIHVRDDWVAEFAPKGFLAPLDDLITDEMVQRLGDKSFKALSYDGKRYGVPRYYWAWQFYYNKSMFEKAGITSPPSTWNQLIEAAGKLQQAGITPYGEALGETFSYTPFIVHLRAEGGEFWDYEKGVPAFNSPAGIKALQVMQEMYKNKATIPTSLEYNNTASMTEAFSQGSFAMMMSNPATFSVVNNKDLSKVAGQIGVSLIPGSVKKTASYAETGGLAIPASSKNKEAAFEFIKFVTSTEQQVKMALGYGSIPADPVAAADSAVNEKYPHYSLIPEQLSDDYGIFVHENAQLIAQTVSKRITAGIQNATDPAKVLADTEQEVLGLLK